MISYLVIWFCLFPFRLNKNKTFQENGMQKFFYLHKLCIYESYFNVSVFPYLQNSTWDLYISDLLCIDNKNKQNCKDTCCQENVNL